MTSSKEASEDFSSDLLVKVAPLACTEILDCSHRKKPLPSALGSRIGTALHLIAQHLEVVQPFQLPDTAQDLSRQVLQDLLKICKWPAKSAATKAGDYEDSHNSLSSLTSCDIYNELIRLEPVVIRAGINSFLAAKQTDVTFYANHFQKFFNLLETDNRKFDGEGQSSLHSKHLKPHESYVYPDDIREKLITALRRHTTCVSEVHMSEAPVETNARHLTRLCLSTEARIVNQLVEFDLAMASMNFEFWQDFSLVVTLSTMSSGPMVVAGTSDDTDGQIAIMKVGDVCRILEDKRFSQSGSKLLLKLDNNCDLHKYQLARTLPYAKSRGPGDSLVKLLDLAYHSPSGRVPITTSSKSAKCVNIATIHGDMIRPVVPLI